MDINLTNPVTTAKIGEVVNGASAATPNDTDLLPVVESSVTKKLTLTNLKAFLKTYFDTLYSNLGYTAENVANKSSSYTLSSTTTYANTKALVDGLATREPLKGSDDNYVTDAQLLVISNTSGTNTGDETAARIGTIVNGASNYATPLDADKIGIWDVANSLFKALTWANLKATLKTYFDTLYSALPLLEYDSSTSVIGSPGDGGVFYSGTINNYAPETGTSYSFISPKNNAVVKVYMQVFVRGTLATTETTTIKLMNLSTTTEETIGSIGHDKRINSASCTPSTLANTVGQNLIVQCTNPTWSTNPTTVHYQWLIKVY